MREEGRWVGRSEREIFVDFSLTVCTQCVPNDATTSMLCPELHSLEPPNVFRIVEHEANCRLSLVDLQFIKNHHDQRQRSIVISEENIIGKLILYTPLVNAVEKTPVTNTNDKHQLVYAIGECNWKTRW